VKRTAWALVIALVVSVLGWIALPYTKLYDVIITETLRPHKESLDRQIGANENRLKKTDEELTNLENNLASAMARAEESMPTLKQLEEKVDTLRASVDEQVEDLKTDARDISARHLRNLNDELISQLSAQHEDFVTYESLDQILEDRGLNGVTLPSKIKLTAASPISLNRQKPTVIYASSVRLEWGLGHRFEDYEYNIEVYDNNDRTKLKLKFSEQDRVYTTYELSADVLTGSVFWRVRARKKDSEDPWTDWKEHHFEFYRNCMERIKSRKVVRVGISSSYIKGFHYYDTGKRDLTGFDVELAKLIAKRIPIDDKPPKAEFYVYNWHNLLNMPRKNEVDFIISTISKVKNRDREYGFHFSEPYYESHQVFVTRKDSKIDSIFNQDRNQGDELVVAVPRHTTSEEVARSFFEDSRIKRVQSTSAALQELFDDTAGVDVVITDSDIARIQLGELYEEYKNGEKSKKDKKSWIEPRIKDLKPDDFPSDYDKVKKDDYVIAVVLEPNRELLNHINNAIRELRKNGKNGEVQQLYKDYVEPNHYSSIRKR
jgi:ABC-type amino acid transport substrate-binding protein